MKILANDGIDNGGKKALEALGFTVVTEKVNQDDLVHAINSENYIGLLVRSATTARKDLIDGCPGLKFIGRGGVGIDNIDAEYAISQGIEVFNTPASSSQSVAELVMSLMFAAARGIYDAGTNMPSTGTTEFNSLKKKYAKGIELRGKQIGIVGFGRIGRSLASYALGCGMKVVAVDQFPSDHSVSVNIEGYGSVEVKPTYVSLEEALATCDFISLHVPKQPNGSAVIGAAELAKCKKGIILVNTSRGGVIEESALIEALNSGQVGAAALDVFVGEPAPNEAILKHPKIVCTPHIGASTNEAQERIGLELASRIQEIMNINA